MRDFPREGTIFLRPVHAESRCSKQEKLNWILFEYSQSRAIQGGVKNL